MGDKDKKELFDFLAKGINGNAYCLYYSSYTFDNNMEINSKQKGKINNKNALFTMILPADFDSIGEDEFQRQMTVLHEIGLESINIFTGHGFQSLILLDSAVYDCQLLDRWTSLLLKKGFTVDPSLRDAARVLRMPFSFNCKGFDKSNKYFLEGNEIAIPTFVTSSTDKRYNWQDVFSRLQSLPDVDSNTVEIKAEIKNVYNDNQICFSHEPQAYQGQTKETNISYEKKKEAVVIDYPMIHNVDNFPDSLIKMLYRTEYGLRNDTMLFLVPFAKNSLGMDIPSIQQVMTVWGQRCIPQLSADFVESEVNRLVAYDFKGKHGLYTKKMAEKFGYFDFSQFKRDNKVKIAQTLIDSMAIMSDSSLRIYLSLLLNNTECRNYRIEDICRISGYKKRAAYRYVHELESLKFLIKKRACKKKGESYEYYLSPYIRNYRFVLLENSTLTLMLQQLSDSELKLYCYLCSVVFSYKKIWMSQNHLADKIGKSQSTVSLLTDNLMKKGFIMKKTYRKQNILHCVYNLNY